MRDFSDSASAHTFVEADSGTVFCHDVEGNRSTDGTRMFYGCSYEDPTCPRPTVVRVNEEACENRQAGEVATSPFLPHSRGVVIGRGDG